MSDKRCRHCGDHLGSSTVMGPFCSKECRGKYLWEPAMKRDDKYCTLCGGSPEAQEHKLRLCVYVPPTGYVEE